MFMIGISLFAIASLAGGFANDQIVLIAARALQGIGAAIASPTAIALIAATFSEGNDRNRAMAVYAAMTAAGGATGLTLGGALVQYASWRWVFFVNVPFAVVALILVPLSLPRLKGHGGHLDIPGAITVSAGAAALIYGIVHAPVAGWGATSTLTAFAASFVLLVVFFFIESKAPQPLIPAAFLRHKNRAGGYAIMLLIGSAMLSMLYFLTQFLQNEMGYSPFHAGYSYLPVPFFVASTSLLAGKRIRKYGTRIFITLGPLFIALGVFLSSFLIPTSSYWHVLFSLSAFGFGMGLCFAPLTLNTVASVKKQEQGLASSLLNMNQQIGGALGLAVAVTISETVVRHLLGGQVHPDLAANVLAVVTGFHDAMRVSAAGAFLAFIIALLTIRNAVLVPSSPLEVVLEPL
jgi:MFS family permease